MSESARPLPPEAAGPPPVGDDPPPPEQVAAAAAEWAARRHASAGQSRDDNRIPPSEYILPAELSRLFNARVTVSSGQDVRLSDVESLNFTAIQIELDNMLEDGQKGVNRQGKMFPSFLTSATALLDIKQVWREIETSVMSSVSCTACKAGEFELSGGRGERGHCRV